MKRSTKKLLFRFSLLTLVTVFSALAIAQAQRGWNRTPASEVQNPNSTDGVAQEGALHPIPLDAEHGLAEVGDAHSPTFASDNASASVSIDDNNVNASRWQGTVTEYDGFGDTQDYAELPRSDVQGYEELPSQDVMSLDQYNEASDQHNELSDPYNELPDQDKETPGRYAASTSPTEETQGSVAEPRYEEAVVEPVAAAVTEQEQFTNANALTPLRAPQAAYRDDDQDAALDTFADSDARFDSSTSDVPAPTDELIELSRVNENELPELSQQQPNERLQPIEDLPAPTGHRDLLSPDAGPDDDEDLEPHDVPQPTSWQTEANDHPSQIPATDRRSNLRNMADPSPGQLDVEATGRPGPTELEGPQTPMLTVEKIAPAEVRVGTASKFLIKVRNVGKIAVDQVLIRDEVPHGTRIVSAVPQADRLSDGAIMWQMGTIKPGEEVTATLELIPLAEGQVGSVATISFQASVSSRSTATQPRLEIEQTAPRTVLIGEDVVLSIRLSNPGTGTATNVILVEDVPDGLKHSAGSELEHEVGTLRPGEIRHLELTLKAAKPGHVQNVLVAHADGNLSARDSASIDIIAPQLEIDITGPSRRYLRRQATFDISLKNPGTAPAKDVQLVAHLPRGLTFVNTNNAGYYDQAAHSVHWSLQELPPSEMGTVRLTVLPIEMGQFKVRAEGTAQSGLSDAGEKQLLIEGLAALQFTVTDLTDPIEVTGQTTYEIRVVNQGSKASTNIRLVAAIPTGMRAIGADGPTQVVVQPQNVTFDPLPRLAPQADAIFQIHVQGDQPGDMRIRVQLSSDEMSKPVTKEESTRVYADE